MPALTRGPLPARVYWVRRLFVLGTAVLLVVGVARLLGSGSDASSDGGDQAAQVAAGISPSASYTPPPVADATTSESPRKPGKPRGTQEPVLAEPEGTCDGSDVAVTPKVESAVAGRDVMIVLQLRTLVSEACAWRVSRDSLTVSITSGDDDIWSSRECPGTIPKEPVVVRKAVTSRIEVVWEEAKRSGERCTRLTEWAMPGWYHVTAAALGGEPSDLQFELGTPTAATITKTVRPTATPTARPTQRATGRPVTPTRSPSGAVEPD